jgi:hypothetical protein
MGEKEAEFLLKSVSLRSRIELTEEGHVENVFVHQARIPGAGKNTGERRLAGSYTAGDLQSHHDRTQLSRTCRFTNLSQSWLFLTSFDIRNGLNGERLRRTDAGNCRCVGVLPMSVFWQTLRKAAELSRIPAVEVLVPSLV